MEHPAIVPYASGWLVSTIDDYWTFVSMVLAGGTGTTWRSSPHSGATSILFSQRQATAPVPPPLI